MGQQKHFLYVSANVRYPATGAVHMRQQLIQKERTEPDEPEKSTKEATELAFAILDTGDGVTVERTATTFAAEVLEQGGERQISIDEETDTTVFTITQEYDVALPTAWDQLDDLMPVTTPEETAERTAWDLLQLHFMTVPAMDAVQETVADQVAPVEISESDTADIIPSIDTTDSIDDTALSVPAALSSDTYPVPETPEQRYEYTELVDTSTSTTVPITAQMEDRDMDTATAETATTAISEEPLAQADDQAPVLYTPDAEQPIKHRLYDTETTETGIEQELTYTVSADSETNAAEAVEQLFEQTDLSGSVEKMTYQDTDDGYREKQSYWVEIDGMDMSRTEFFINGELAEESLDAYDLDPGDSITFVEADLFDSGDGDGGAACGGELYLEDVIDDYADDDITAVNAAYGMGSPDHLAAAHASGEPAQQPYMAGA
jgi:hypothetical protein